MGKRSEALLAMFNTVNIISVLLIPSLVISLTIAEPLPGGSVIFMAMVLWMKLVSYAHCNADLRYILPVEILTQLTYYDKSFL